MKRKFWIIAVMGLLALILAGCAPGANAMTNIPDGEGEIAGFWIGLWHGFTSPVMFIISLFNSAVEVFEVHNNGGWYTFGFLLGASCIFGGSGGSACKSRRRNRD